MAADLVAVIEPSNTKFVASAATTNAALVKAGVRKLLAGVFTNVAAYDVFIKFYDKATAPTVGTDTPFLTVKVPTGGAPVDLGKLGDGIQTTLGLGFAITKLIADTDATAVAAGDVRGAFNWG